MKTRIKIKLQKARIGQVLAHDVIDFNGNCLINESVVLTGDMISNLQQRAVDTIVVWGQALNENEIIVQQHAFREKLAHRFRRVQNNSEMCLLHDILLSWRLENTGVDSNED